MINTKHIIIHTKLIIILSFLFYGIEGQTQCLRLNPGSIGSNQTICYNASPAAFTNITSASGGSGSFAFQWQSTAVSGCGSGWGNISGATASTYQAGNLTQTTCYRREVTSSPCGTGYSNTITVTVYPNLTAGSVGSNQSICYNTSPAAFTQTAAPTGGTGSYTYQWQYSTLSNCSGGWSNISGATATSYQPPTLTSTTCYRRNVTSGSCGTVSSNAITVTVYANLTAGSVGSNQSICYNTSPAAFTQTAAPTGGIGSYTYQWQSTTVSGCGSGWGNISGATASTYNFTGNLTQTTCYRRNVSSGSCGTVSSAAITVTVYANLTAGIVESSQTICNNATPVAFTQFHAPTGGTCSYTYQWQSTTVSGCGSGWSNVSGATASTYQAGNLTQTTCYRRNVTSGSCGTVSSGAITVTVYANLTAGSVGSNQSICYNTSPAAFTQVSAPTGGTGSYTYQWQYTTAGGCGSGWSNVSGATASTYHAGNLTQTTCYRRNVTSGSCGTVSSSAITVTVYDLPVADAGSDVSIFMGDSAQIGSSPIGGNTYEWSPATGLSCTNCANPIAFPSSIVKYDVTVTDNNGCSASDRIIIEIKDFQYMGDGVFEEVFDRFGNSFSFEKIKVDTTSACIFKTTLQCENQSGYFNLYFDDNWEGSTINESDRRNVICQLFTDLSDFITPADTNFKVNIWIRDINDIVNNSSSSQTLGVGSAFYLVPSNATSASGIVDNEIWKTINSGTDSYTNVMSPFISKGQNFPLYHGFIALNFFNQSYNWHHDLTQQTQTNSYDLYTVALNEVMHTMGFASLINADGNSKLGPNYNYYSRYDIFLKTASNDNLIQNTGSCSMYNYSFNSSLQPNVMTPTGTPPGNCSNHILFGGNVEQPVYSPLVFDDESSLSHFEDICNDPGYYNDNQYYVMSDMQDRGPLYMKRYLKEEERGVLCNLGYNVGAVYGSANNLNYYDLYSGTCDGLEVAGVNDGIIYNPNIAFSYVMSVSSSPLLINDILSNDLNAVSFECLEDLYGNGYPDVTSGTSFTYYATSPGLAVLRYIPVAANGNRGNITYIYLKIKGEGNSLPPSPCELVYNGTFENPPVNCGAGIYGASVDSWYFFSQSPDVFKRGCTTYLATNIDTNTWWSNPPSDSYGGTPNDVFIGFYATHLITNSPYIEAIQTTLYSPLLPGEDYIFSLVAKVNNYYSNIPLPLFCGSSVSNMPFPNHISGQLPSYINLFAPTNQTTVPANVSPYEPLSNWYDIQITFTFTGSTPHSNLIIGVDGFNLPLGSPVYVFIDNVSIIHLPKADAGTDQTICSGASVNLSASGGLNYEWSSNPSGFSSYLQSPSANPTVTTTYTVTVSDDNGCSASDDVVITVIPGSVTSQIDVVDETCFGSYDGSIEITSANGTPPYSYVWQNSTNTTNLLSDLTTGTYYVTVTDDAGCYNTLYADVTSLNNYPWPYQPSNGTDKEKGTSVAVDDDGNVYAVGFFQGDITFGNTTYSTNGGQDIYIVKFDKCGNVLWSKRVGGSGAESANKIIVDNSGNIIITGYFSQTVNFGGGNRTAIGYTTDLFVAKYDDDGNWIWDRTFDGLYSNNDAGNDLAFDGAGNIYVVGTMDMGIYDYDVFIIALSPAGTTIWTQNEGFSSEDYGQSITFNSFTSELLITGQKNGNIFVSKYDLYGSQIVSQLSILGAGQSIVADDNNNVFLAGYSESAGVRSLYLAQVNVTTLALTTLFQTTSTVWDYFTDIAIDQNGDVYLAGLFCSPTITLPIIVTPTTYNNSGNSGADNFVTKYSPANNWFCWFTQSGSSVNPTDAINLGIALDNNGFGYVTGQFMGAAIFNNTTIYSYPYPTYPYTTDAFIARFQDLYSYGSYRNLIVQDSATINIAKNNNIMVYPNPATNSFTIDIDLLNEESTKIILYNAIGSAIKEILNCFVQSQSLTVDVKDIPTGNYFIRIETSKQVYIKRIVLIRQG